MKLKHIILSLAVVALGVFTTQQAKAQEVFHKGTQTASVLLGMSSTGFSNVIVPPILLNYEYGVADNIFNNGNGSIGVGAVLVYSAIGTRIADLRTTTHSTTIGPRGTLHYQFLDKLDTYWGLTLGILLHSTTSVTEAGSRSGFSAGFGWGSQLGARYYFTPNFAGNLELGYGYSVVNLGITYRF